MFAHQIPEQVVAASASLASPDSGSVASASSAYDQVRTAADELVALLIATYSDAEGRLHAETAIAAGAALAGEFSLRSTRLPLPAPSTLVAGGSQDGVLFGDPPHQTAWSMVAKAATVAGLEPDELPDIAEILGLTLLGFGEARFPPLTVPRQHFPRETPLNAGPRLREQVRAIADRNELSLGDLVPVLGWAVGSLIVRTRLSLPPAISVRLAAEVMIAMSRVGPLPEPVAAVARL